MSEPSSRRPLGASGVSVPALGVGTDHWDSRGDQSRLCEAYSAAIESGCGFFDTAEIYAWGRSEIALARAAAEVDTPVMLASKFAPLFRVSGTQFAAALDRTLHRLGRESIDLYYLHFPYGFRGVGTWLQAMAEAVAAGKIRAVGISNCSAAQMRRAADVLAGHGIALAANQVHYSLRHRKPETNGVLEACRSMNVALVAYRPLGGGRLSSAQSTKGSTLVETLRDVAANQNASVAAVALAWLLHRDQHVIAIPGATKPEHVRANAIAQALQLSAEEFAAIDRASQPQR